LRVKRPSDTGAFIVLEGIDGAGKSTQFRRLSERLTAERVPFVASREPTDGPHGRRLRESATRGRLSPDEELATFLADRREHVRELILPSLASGKVVVLDRYYFSTAAYQGARGFEWREIVRDNEAFAPEPDLLFWFELSPELSQQRIGRRGEAVNDFEQLESLRAVAGIYEEMASRYPFVRRLDARRTADELHAEMWSEFRNLLVSRRPYPDT